MAIDKIFGEGDIDGVADSVFSAVNTSIFDIKAMQQRKVAQNVQVVIQALKKIESNLQDRYDGVTTTLEKKAASLKDGRDGLNGANGKEGKDGRPGRDGAKGERGANGVDGRNGRDGVDGVSVTNAYIDFDGSLIINLSDGQVLNVGEVVAPDLAEKIKVITNGGGTSQGVLDAIAALQATIATYGTMALQNANNVNITGGTVNPGTLREAGVSAVVQTDIGTEPNEIPLNQYLGNLAYQDAANIAGPVGVGGALTLNAGTANGVAFLNGSKQLTTGSALTFDGTKLYVQGSAGGTTATFTDATNSTLNITHSAGGLVFLRDGGNNRQIGLNDQSLQFFAGNAEQMRLTSTGLSIGTSSVGSGVHISKPFGSQLRIQESGGTYFDIAAGGRFDLKNAAGTTIVSIAQSGSPVGTQLNLDSSGNLGIGTSSPDSKVVSNYGTLTTLNTSDIRTISAMTLTATDPGETSASRGVALTFRPISGRGAVASIIGFNSGSNKEDNGTLAFYRGGGAYPSAMSESMRIDSAGNVGIGTSSPASKLHVQDGALEVNTSSANGAVVRINFNSTDSIRRIQALETGGGNARPLQFQAQDFRFRDDTTERARITAAGDLLVGTTSVPTGSTGGSGFVVESVGRRTLKVATTTTGGAGLAEFINPNGVVGTISVSGSTTTYGITSDYRLKEAVTPMQGALARVAALKPCTYKWKVDGSDGEGFIAHELQAVVPDCVTGEKDAVDSEGKPQYQGIDTSFLVATLTAAIQEQQAIIESLTARITALESK